MPLRFLLRASAQDCLTKLGYCKLAQLTTNLGSISFLGDFFSLHEA
jgi:hypothetical protein